MLRRLDHSNIFLIIAGTYTPITLLLLGEEGHTAAVAGLGRRRWPGSRSACSGSGRRAGSTRRSTSPWAGPRCSIYRISCERGGAALVTLVIIGGVLYSLGALVYAFKRPDPSPRWFGFHEVFHAFTLAAFVVHYIAVSMATYDYVPGRLGG